MTDLCKAVKAHLDEIDHLVSGTDYVTHRLVQERMADITELLKPILPPAIDPTDDHFQAVLICALRYCMGRATYMPGLVTGWIMGHMRGRLSENTLGVMKQDIDGTPEDRRGMDCDRKTWARFREWLEVETP